MKSVGKTRIWNIYPLQPNLPALTFIDLLQIVAKTTETAILYDEIANEISFEFDDTAYSINITKKSRGSLLRRFLKFCTKKYRKVRNSENYN